MMTFSEYIKELKKIPEYQYLWSLKTKTTKRGSFNSELYCKFLKARIR